MPPRKRAAVAPEFPHAESCTPTPDRMESFVAVRPNGGRVTVTRCQECGAQTTE